MKMKYQWRILPFLSMLLLLNSCEKEAGADEGGKTDEKEIVLPAKEFRAAWIATVGNIDWPSNVAKGNVEQMKSEYIAYLDLFKKANLNAVVFQIRPTADAFYPSTLEPWSQWLTGVQGGNPGFDVLRFAIDEAHKRGLQLHAWMNPFRIANTLTPSLHSSHIIHQKPAWKMAYGGKLYFNPGIPECREFFFKVIDELLANYNVDGIHFDDYFYPYPVSGEAMPDQVTFETYNPNGIKNIADWRRENVNMVVKGVYERVMAKPGVVFGVSPFPTWRHKSVDPTGSQTSGTACYDDLYADTKKWCDEGWIHYICPQLYGSTENASIKFSELLMWWSKNAAKAELLIGMPMYKFGVPAEGAIFQSVSEFTKEFSLCRMIPEYKGNIQYNATAFTKNLVGITDELNKLNSGSVLRPALRKSGALPATVTLRSENGTLRWNESANIQCYAVYKFIVEGDKKVGTLITTVKELSFAGERGAEYGVTAISSFDEESVISNLVTL